MLQKFTKNVDRPKKVDIASVIKYEGDNSTFIWKSPLEDFNTQTQLIVHESQEAVFYMNGQALDLFGPGRYTLHTENIPLIRRILSLPTGGKTPFHCEVYFINKTHQMGVKWGTDSQVQYMEPTYKFPLQIGASGEMVVEVSNSKRLLIKIVGTEKQFTQTTLTQLFRALLMSKIKPYIAKTMQEAPYSIFEVDAHMDEFSDALHTMLSGDFLEYGLNLRRFFVTTIAKPDGETAYEKYKELHIRTYSDVASAELKQRLDIIEEETAKKRRIIEAEGMAEKKKIGRLYLRSGARL